MKLLKKVSLILFIILTIIFLLNGVFTVRMNYLKRFSKERWNTNIAHRKYMIEDLVNSYELIGMTKDEVIQLLGKNEMFLSGKDPIVGIHYIIGMGYIDPLILDISLDNFGRVEKYGVGTG